MNNSNIVPETIDKPEDNNYKPKKDKPPFKDFCLMFCKQQLYNVDNKQREMKKWKKQLKEIKTLYIKLENNLKNCESEDHIKVATKDHQYLHDAYNQLDNELVKIDKQVKESIPEEVVNEPTN